MAVSIEDVPMWVIFSGIGHAVGSRNCEACFTACGHMIYGHQQSYTPNRICRKCRARLKEQETSLIVKSE
jgi:hypothetical protein